MGRRAFYLFLFCLICGYSSNTLGADQGLINSGETHSSTIGPPSFMDTWTFEGQAGERVIINATTTSGTLNTRILLFPPGGGPKEADTATADQLDYQLKNTGLYTIVIEDYYLSNSGNYNITFLKIPGAVSSEADPDGGPIASGQTINAIVNAPSDMDAFHFYGQAGERVIINAVTTSGTLNTRILLFPPGGGPKEADTATADQLDYQLKNTGLYTIVIEDYYLSNSGKYNLSLSKIPAALNPGIYNQFPANGATICNINRAFNWSGVTVATGYDLYFGSDPTQPPQKIGDNLASPSLAFPPLTRGQVYYWQVVAHTASGDIQGPYCWFLVSTKPCPGLGWLPLLLLE